MPPTVVVSAPGTRTVLNLKVKVGAAATVAAIMNTSTKTASSTDLQIFIFSPWDRIVLAHSSQFFLGHEKRQRLYTAAATSGNDFVISRSPCSPAPGR